MEPDWLAEQLHHITDYSTNIQCYPSNNSLALINILMSVLY